MVFVYEFAWDVAKYFRAGVALIILLISVVAGFLVPLFLMFGGFVFLSYLYYLYFLHSTKITVDAKGILYSRSAFPSRYESIQWKSVKDVQKIWGQSKLRGQLIVFKVDGNTILISSNINQKTYFGSLLPEVEKYLGKSIEPYTGVIGIFAKPKL